MTSERPPAYVLPVKAYEAVRRLAVRFNVAGGLPTSPWLSRVIVPVTLVDQVLENTKIVQSDSGNIAAGSGAEISIHAVPTGKRQRILWLRVTRLTGDNTFGVTRLIDASEGKDMDVDITATQTNRLIPMTQPFQLDQGDTIRIVMDGVGVAITTVRMYLHVVEIDAYS